MTTVIVIPGNTASTFLTHFFGNGLSDDTYVVERFKAMVDGDIVRCPDAAPANGKGRRKAKYASASLEAVKEMQRVPKAAGICPSGRPQITVNPLEVVARVVGPEARGTLNSGHFSGGWRTRCHPLPLSEQQS